MIGTTCRWISDWRTKLVRRKEPAAWSIATQRKVFWRESIAKSDREVWKRYSCLPGASSQRGGIRTVSINIIPQSAIFFHPNTEVISLTFSSISLAVSHAIGRSLAPRRRLGGGEIRHIRRSLHLWPSAANLTSVCIHIRSSYFYSRCSMCARAVVMIWL